MLDFLLLTLSCTDYKLFKAELLLFAYYIVFAHPWSSVKCFRYYLPSSFYHTVF